MSSIKRSPSAHYCAAAAAREGELADNLVERVRWYQAILRAVGPYPEVPLNGKHNDPATRAALRTFQRAFRLEPSGYLTVEANAALTQRALERLYARRLPNTPGQFGPSLRAQIAQFQRDYGLADDGAVGPFTRDVMLRVLEGALPSPLRGYHYGLGQSTPVPTGVSRRATCTGEREQEVLPDQGSDDRVRSWLSTTAPVVPGLCRACSRIV